MNESSSIDGSLNSSVDGDMKQLSEIDNSGLSSNDPHDIKKLLSDMRRSRSVDGREESIMEKMTNLIDERGYSLPLIDYNRLLIMAPDPEALEEWMESVMNIFLELFQCLESQRSTVVNAAQETQRKDVSQEALYAQIEKLQNSVQELQYRESELKRKLLIQEESTTSNSRDGKKLEVEYKKKLKNLEGIIQEHERRYRVKEQEFEKLKKKLAFSAEKEAESVQRTKDILQVLNTRDLVLIDQSFSEMGIGASPARKGSTNTNVNSSHLSARSTSTANSKRGPPASTSNVSNPGNRLTKEERIENLTYALKAMESDRRELLSRNLELELQVKGLLEDLNNGPTSTSYNVSHQEDSLERDTSFSSSPVMKKMAPTAMSASRTLREQELLDEMDAEKRSFQQIIDRQRQRIEELQQKHDILSAFQEEGHTKIETLRGQLSECHQEIENLRLQLDARPSIRQWTTAQREIHDLERKVHDLVMLRGEAAEIEAWRKHLSTSERIRIDKRNHELGLWLLDSLPKNVMKESLQTVCRELDLSDLSEIPQAIHKLKTVVRAVPRMERFISKVTSFVSDRTVLLNDRLGLGTPDLAAHESLEKTMQQLQRWWMLVQKCVDLEEFRESVLFELFRANELIHGDFLQQYQSRDAASTQAAKKQYAASIAALSPQAEAALQSRLMGFWNDHGRQDWLLRDPSVLLAQLRDMADLQTEVLQSRSAISAAEVFMQERPDLLVHRVLSHIQYLLEVKNIDGILPTINKLYIFSEEMKNFLAAVRSAMGKEKNTPVAVITDDILSLLTRMKVKVTPTALSSGSSRVAHPTNQIVL
jgi:hypothetical protein